MFSIGNLLRYMRAEKMSKYTLVWQSCCKNKIVQFFDSARCDSSVRSKFVNKLWGEEWRIVYLAADCHEHPGTPSLDPVRRSRDVAETWRRSGWTCAGTETSVRRARMAEIPPPILPLQAAVATPVDDASMLDFVRKDLRLSALSLYK